MIKCSIIATSHDRPEYLKEAIDSILAQSMPEWELIIVDSSTDPRVKTVLDEAKEDERISVLTEPRNVGIDNQGNLAQAWNRALDHVRGEYIALLDDDNRKKIEFCKRLSGYLDAHPEYDAACCFSENLDEHGNVTPPGRTPIGMNKTTILGGNYVDSGELMMRSSVIDLVGYFDERLHTVEDWDMVIRLLYETKGVGILEEVLTQYRFHPGRRMPKTLEIHKRDSALIQAKRHGGLFKVAMMRPDDARLTCSQRQVCISVANTIPRLPFVGTHTIGTIKQYDPGAITSSDIVLVLAPFQIKSAEMELLASASRDVPIVVIHMEDPQAILSNESCARFAQWVVTNDVSAIERYKTTVDPKKVLFCPSLSISSPVLAATGKWPKKYDVVFCGTGYDSRRKYMSEFLKKMPNLNICLIGDGWEKLDGHTARCSTQNEVTTMEIYHSTKIVVCKHRTNNDMGGFPITPPRSIQRGYIEAYSGALVMVDDTREQSSFGPDEIVRFGSPDDLKEKICYYLAHPKVAEEFAMRAKTRATRDFTFKTRLTKVINCVRSERYEMVIP